MKYKPIIADPLRLHDAGIRSLGMAATLIHIGRCGLVGTTIPRMKDDLKMSASTLDFHVGGLVDMGLAVTASKANSKGRPINYVVTVKGWGLLTTPPDFSMFPWAHSAIKLP